jgi:hypothetical protein
MSCASVASHVAPAVILPVLLTVLLRCGSSLQLTVRSLVAPTAPYAPSAVRLSLTVRNTGKLA